MSDSVGSLRRPRPMRRRFTLGVAVVALVFGLPGCSPSRLTFENYERIRDGMSAADVRAILGEPDTDKGGGFAFGGIDASGRVMIWDEDDRFVQVTLVRGKVVGKIQKGLE